MIQKFITVATLLWLLPCLPAQSHAQQYQVIDLGGYDWSYGDYNSKSTFDINNYGQVLMGNYLWTPATRNGTTGTKVPFPLLPGAVNGAGYSLNDNGWIVGACRFSSPLVDKAFLWQPNVSNGTTGTTQQLDPIGYSGFSYAVGINNSGWVVGRSGAIPRENGGNGSFLWTPSGGMQPLAGGQRADSSFVTANAINNAGVAGGHDGYVPSLWLSPAARVPLSAPGYARGFVNSLNDAGQSVGYMFNGGSYANYGSPAFLWENGTATYITEFSAQDINNNGQVVGSNTSNHPLLWSREAGLRNLYNELGRVGYAHAINDAGQIVISSGGRAYLLTPIVSVVAPVSGHITLEGAGNQAQPVTFVFHPTNGTAAFQRTVNLAADGTFRLEDIPRKAYTLWVKGPRWLAKSQMVDTTNGEVSNITYLLPAGDVNQDNVADIEDLLLLIAHYNTQGNAVSDLNDDGITNITDLLLLLGNYNQSGDSSP